MAAQKVPGSIPGVCNRCPSSSLLLFAQASDRASWFVFVFAKALLLFAISTSKESLT